MGLFEPCYALERVLWCGRAEDFRNRHGGPARVALNLEPTFSVHNRHEILRYSWLVGLKSARSRTTPFVRGSIDVVTCLAPSNWHRSQALTTEPTTQAISRQRRPRGRYPKTQDSAIAKRQKRIPEYLEADEVNAIIRAAPNPKVKLLMLEQWRAGLRVSEALDLEVRDLSLDTPNPTLRVRAGKGGKSRLVPVHPELHEALSSALAYGDISQGRIVEAHPTTAWRWVQAAVKRAEELSAIAPGKKMGTHTLRHSYAHHMPRLFGCRVAVEGSGEKVVITLPERRQNMVNCSSDYPSMQTP